MIFDLIFGIVVAGIVANSSSSGGTASAPFAATESAPVLSAPPAPPDVSFAAVEQLACHSDPDPTPILRSLMDHGLIHASGRMDIDAYSCFEIPGGMALSGITVNAVCGGVVSPDVNAANPDLYAPQGHIRDDDRYPMISFGTNDDYDLLVAWSRNLFGPRAGGRTGVIDGLYTPSFLSQNEVYCNDLLAQEIALTGVPGGAGEDMPPTDGQAVLPLDESLPPVVVDIMPPPAPPPAP